MTGETLIYGLDPGKANGIVIGYYSEDEPFTVLDALELEGGPVEVGEHFASWLAMTFGMGPRRLIYEAFETTGGHGHTVDGNWSIQPIGAVLYIASQVLMDRPRVTGRRPGPPASITCEKEALRKSGYWLVGGEGHKRAIMAHILGQLIETEFHEPTRRQLFGR